MRPQSSADAWPGTLTERGAALLVVVMVTLVLLGVTGAVIPLATTETDVSANHRRAVQVRYAAEAALELAVVELRTGPSWNEVLRGRFTARLWSPVPRFTLADGVVIDLGRITDALQPRGREAVEDRRWRLFAHGPFDELVQAPVSQGLLHVAVWVADDGDGDGDPDSDANTTVVVRSTAFGPQRARQTVQAVLRRRPGGRAEVVTWRGAGTVWATSDRGVH